MQAGAGGGGGLREVGSSAFEGFCVLQHVREWSPRASLHWGEDLLWGVRVWAAQNRALLSLHGANKEASLSAHNVPSVLSAARW